jgi:hypothetical protein
MIEQYLFVGVGGSGGKTLRAIKEEITSTLRSANWDFDREGFPVRWQFLQVDTPTNQDGDHFNARPLEEHEYLGLVKDGVTLDSIINNIQLKNFEQSVKEEILRPFPRVGEYTERVDKGAGQYRAIGRTVAISRLEQISKKISAAVDLMSGPKADAQAVLLEALLKQPVTRGLNPTVIVVSSLAGGSGSGQFLDVCEAIKAAKPNDNWTHSQIALLFAPDVFKDVTVNNEGIAPNSLLAASELSTATWRRNRSEPLKNLYGEFGFFDAKTNLYNVGPKHVFLVGRQNSKVVFGSQDDVYHATAASLAKWATDSGVSEQILNYILVNPQTKEDRLGLKVPGHLFPPFNSLGFARVSLGVDGFADFAAQSLARAAVEALVNGHVPDAQTSEPESVIIEQTAKSLKANFQKDSGLVPALMLEGIQSQSARSKWKQDFESELRENLASESDDSGRSRSETSANWIDSIESSVDQLRDKYFKKFRDSRNVIGWSTQFQRHVEQVVAEYSANYGMKVAEKLLDLQISQFKGAPPVPVAPAKSLLERLSEVFAKGLAGTIDSKSDEFSKAIEASSAYAEYEPHEETKALLGRLVKEMVSGFLEPLRDELKSRHTLLRDAMLDKDYKNTKVNKFKSWPDGNSVPVAFKPQQNVRLLIPHETYLDQFKKLLTKSVQAPSPEAAITKAVAELVGGSDSIEELRNVNASGGGNKQSRAWESFRIKHDWVPSGLPAPQHVWQGEFQDDLLVWEDNAQKYVRIAGRPLGKLISQDLSGWLSVKDPSERQEREDKLVAELSSVVSISAPFAQINVEMLQAAHGTDQPQNSVILSDIPVALESTETDLGARLKAVLATVGLDDFEIEKAFKGTTSSAKTIDIFTTLGNKVHYVVFDNLMEPIIKSWKIAKNDPGKRHSFLRLRISRNLPEAIPFAPEVLEQVLRGWFVAKFLGRLKFEAKDRISIHQESEMDAGQQYFPSPLLYPYAVIDNPLEYPTIVAMSANVALMNSSESKSISPFEPYKSLMDLGGDVTSDHLFGLSGEAPSRDFSLSPSLREWIISGAVPDLAPEPQKDVAGTKLDTPSIRKSKAQEFIERERAAFNTAFVELAPGKRHNSWAWQLRREHFAALDTLKQLVDQLNVD